MAISFNDFGNYTTENLIIMVEIPEGTRSRQIIPGYSITLFLLIIFWVSNISIVKKKL